MPGDRGINIFINRIVGFIDLGETSCPGDSALNIFK